MSASEEYSSGEDEDYVPSGAEYSEDDASELVAEEEEEEAAAASPRPARGRRSPRRAAGRKRKKGGLLLESGEKEEEKAQQNNEEEEVDNLKQAERDREEEEKKKEDALWASFLSDVGQKPKVLTATQVTQTSKAEEKSVNKLQEKSKEPEKPKDAGKLTITEVFDFAGEEVRLLLQWPQIQSHRLAVCRASLASKLRSHSRQLQAQKGAFDVCLLRTKSEYCHTDPHSRCIHSPDCSEVSQHERNTYPVYRQMWPGGPVVRALNPLLQG
ncbi:craniofacial development protein 1 isoform X4 [Apteryx rowi]|nr:craniofacial development protein 1 isoform X4 [Apteryx rowi]